MVEEHQGEQPVDLGVVHQGRQVPGQSDRFGREVDVAGIALVEDEVEHTHHRAHFARTIDTGVLDAKAQARRYKGSYTIFEGSSEIQRLIIARAISGVHH
jgi:alkylation response protein AidB-like acyl-CoA dehydrogenase